MLTSKHRSMTTAPTSVLALMESLGPTRAAAQLGVSTTTLYSARKRGYISRVVEIAAEGALRQPVRQFVGTADKPKAEPAAPRNEATVICLIEVGKSKAHVVEQVAKALGAEFIAS